MQAADNFSLKGKTILITGATSGIGLCCAKTIFELGATPVLSGRGAEKLDEAAAQIGAKDAPQIRADFAEEADIESLAKSVPQLDGLVSCAGVNMPSMLKFADAKDIENTIKINATSQILLAQFLLKSKKINAGASLVFISSTSAFLPQPAMCAYAASKAALIGFVKALAPEIAPRKCRANTLCPGLVKTPMTRGFLEENPDLAKIDEAKYPLGYGEAQDVANAAAFLLSGAARWITGTQIVIDGGLTGSK
ncbi:MAG: SDR family oxidoreductase [Opitutales bacterium]|nr:SDR family oxidoreductase [Opitutales bacterium]